MAPRVRLKARWRLVRGTVKGFLWFFAAVVLIVLIVLQTGPGHRVALSWALNQAEARVAGQIEVDHIRSSSLLRGARLVGIRLRTPEGDLLLSADSAEVSYRLFSLVRGDLVMGGVDLWRPELRLESASDGEPGTLDRWLGTGREEGAGGGAPPALRFEGVNIHDGRVVVHSPLADPADTTGLLRWTGEPEALQRTFEIDSLDARLAWLAIGEDDAVVAADITRLAAVVGVLREPVHLDGVRGGLRLESGTLTLQFDRATVDDATAAGAVSITLPTDDRGVAFEVDLEIEQLALAKYRWIIDPLPALEGAARLSGSVGPDGQRWRVSDLDAGLEGGRVLGEATVVLGGQRRFEAVDLSLTAVPLFVFQPWLPGDSLPISALLDGELRASGPLLAPAGDGSFSLRSSDGAEATGTFQGGVALPSGGPVGVRDMTLVLEYIDWRLLTPFAPSFRLTGPGSGRVTATGNLDDGLRFDADLRHSPPESVESHVLATGSLRATDDDDLALDVQGDISPLSFTALRRDYPTLPFSGEIEGAVRARGLLSALEVRAEVETQIGGLDLLITGNVRDPGEGYHVEGSVQDFMASDVVPALPEPTRFSGQIEFDGRGLDPATMELDLALDLGSSSVAGLAIDTVRVAARVAQGSLTLDTLSGRAAGFSIEAGGTLAVDSTRPEGELRVAFETASLLGIRPLFMGDTVIAADTLGSLEREILRLSGVEPDTLPLLDDVQVDGSATGEIVLTGWLHEFAARGTVVLEDVRYGRSTLASGRVEGSAEGLPGLAGAVHLEIETGAAEVFGRSFSEGRAEIDYERPEGVARLSLDRSDQEDYRATADFRLDSLGGDLRVQEMGLRFDTLEYALATPASLQWDDSAFTVRDFELVRPGPDPLSISAEGRLPRQGVADFELTGRGVRLERLAQLIQREDLDVSGRLDLDLRIEGTAAVPIIEGSFSGTDLVAKTAELSAFEGEFTYSDRQADLRIGASRDDLRILELEGVVPVDLALQSVADRTPSEGMDVRVRADSLPAVFVLSLLENLEDVQGTVSGEMLVVGGLDDPEPSGTLRLRGGGWTVAALGVRQSAVQADLDIATDGVVEVSAQGRAGDGGVSIDGTVTLDPVADPGLDLRFRLDRFQGVDRRDVEGTLSGEVELTQRFRRPVVTGQLRVDEGILHLEEFQRSAGVVDLSDPRFLTYVDTTILRGRPLLGETRNPFMDSLRVNIDLDVQRGTWLRSPQMNVEIGGNLIVTYDRAAKDIVMIGELEAVRGQYQLVSRTFDVQSGTVEFVGTPGIDPNLDIQAAARVRRREADPLVITANLTGTLVDPRVRLSTEAGTIPESDLISYLIFGRPSSEVNSLFAGGSGGGEGFLGEGVSIATSTVVSSLASLAQGVGWFDYLSVSQAADVSAAGGGLSPLAGTQLEVGQYFLGGDYFAAVTLRPLSGQGQSSGNILGGFRLEWQASDQYHVEAFAEDRFLRGGGYGFQELGIRSSLIYGLLLFREWGY